MKLSSSSALLVTVLVGALVACTSGAPDGPPLDPPAASSRPASTVLPSGLPAEQRAEPLAADVPSRVTVPGLAIDLPIVSGDLSVEGNPADYPLCDVAQYLTTYRFPGRPGTTTWIYAHAREGMFLPLLAESERDDGRELIGQTVHVFSDGAIRYTYRVTDVLRHATDRGAARDVPETGRRLILQTSEGPRGTVPKLQVVAELVSSEPATGDEATPPAAPRVCYEAP